MTEDLQVSFIQTFLQWEKIEDNLHHFSSMLEGLEETDLVLLPEMFNTGFTMNSSTVAEKMDGVTMSWMKQKAIDRNVVICGSLIIEDGGQYYNRLIWMRPDGSCAHYDKKHLFRMAEEHKSFSPGKNRLIVELKGWKIFPQICYDLRFPVYSRNNFRIENDTLEAEYDLSFYIANWPASRVSAWSTLLKARAIENQAYVLGVNRIGEDGNGIIYNGQSVAIDAKGDVIKSAKDKDAVFRVNFSKLELESYRSKFPVGMDRDKFALI